LAKRDEVISLKKSGYTTTIVKKIILKNKCKNIYYAQMRIIYYVCWLEKKFFLRMP